MGLWNWLLDAITGGSGPRHHGSSGYSHRESQGVATLDRPVGTSDSPDLDSEESWWAPPGRSVHELQTPVLMDQTPEIRALESLLISHFDGHDLNLPPLMQTAERVLARLRDRDVNLGVLAREIADDPVIAASVLRLANSPLYRGMNKITALQPAATRLGVKALRTLMMHESLKAAVFHERGGDVELAESIWRCSIAGGVVMRGLSRFARIDEEDGFLYGLLHDIGSVIVLRIVLSDTSVQHYGISSETFEYLCHQAHQEFGELVAEAWKLPGTLKSLIANHHGDPMPDDPLHLERCLIQITDMIVGLLGYAAYVPYDLLNTRQVQSLALDQEPQFLEFLSRLPSELDEAFSAF